MKVSIKGLQVAINTVADKGDVRFYLCGVFMKESEIAATNGHILSVYNQKNMETESWNGLEIIIPTDNISNFLKRVSKHATEYAMAELAKADGDFWTISFKYLDKKSRNVETIVELFKPIDAKYPDYKRMLIADNQAQKPQGTMCFNSDYLTTLNKIAKVAKVTKTNNGDLLGVQLDFYGHNSPVKVSFVDPRITVILMPMRHITPKVD